MEWTYTINALSRPRVLMRVVQVFDQQMVPMRECRLIESGNSLRITVIIDAGEDLARRMHAKLYKQLDMEHIDLVGGRSGQND
ncbi:MAG: hypothetical protein JWM43_525 [Acidobacteriaceae bacterium]|nr:hypothetical protein [Acidobacteriaceae bacterium]